MLEPTSPSGGSSHQQDESISEPGTVLEEPSHLVDIKAKQRDACGFQNAEDR
ncbi:hypothetical protein Bca4012_019854 [Brassica carinata]